MIYTGNRNKMGTGSAHAVIMSALLFSCCFCFLIGGCAQSQHDRKPEAEQDARHVYKDIKPEVYPVPESVAKALPGLQNDNLYVYREVAPTINLLAYVPDYSLPEAARMAATAFTGLAYVPDFRKGIKFWIIQIQPEAGSEQVPQSREDINTPTPVEKVFVWGVKPGEVDAYKKTGDLPAFIRDSEYLMIDDVIIPQGSERMKHFPEFIKPLETEASPTEDEKMDEKPTLLPGDTADAGSGGNESGPEMPGENP